MKLTSLIGCQRTRVKIDEVELWMERLSWKKLEEFQNFTMNIGKDEEQAENSETKETFILAEHVLLNYTTDKEGDPVITQEDVSNLPVDFCLKVVQKFLAITRGEDDVKKK